MINSPEPTSRNALKLRRARVCAVSLAAGLVAFGLAVYATSKWGIGVSKDSIDYFYAASSLANGHGLRLPDHTPMTMWPPLFPAMLAVGAKLGLGLAQWARLMNVTLFAALVTVSAFWAQKHFRSRIVVALMILIVTMSVPLLDVSIKAWSEPMFIIMTVISLMAIGAYLERPSWPLLVTAAALAGMAELTRYAGIPLIAMSLVLVIVNSTTPSWRRRVMATVVYGFVACIGPALWLLRNRLVADAATPTGYASAVPLHDNVRKLVETIGNWFIPLQRLGHVTWLVDGRELQYASWATGGAAFVMLAFSIMLLRRKDVPRAFIPMSLFVVAYVAFLLAATSLFTANVPYVRYLAPAFVPTIFSIGLVLDRVFTARRGALRASLITVTVAVVSVLWLVSTAVNTAHYESDRRDRGAGFYATNRWMHSRIVSQLRTQYQGALIISNFTDAIRYFGRADAQWAPMERPFESSTTKLNEIPELQRKVAQSDRPTYLIWFNIGTRGIFATPETLSHNFNLTLVHRYRDATMYQVTER